MFWAEKISQEETKHSKEVEQEKKTISETHAKGVAKLVLAESKRTKNTERIYSQKFVKEETKARKDTRYQDVTL